MSNLYTYALLGQSCQTNMDVLTSNVKFFPLRQKQYDELLTKTNRYPGPAPADKRQEFYAPAPQPAKSGCGCG